MPLTPAERMRRRRQKLKDEDKYENFKEKNREEMQKSRAEKKLKLFNMNRIEKEEYLREQRKRSKESVAKSRLNKKKANQPQSLSPYKSKHTLGKAVARATRSLPISPRKKKVVLKQLFQKIVPSEERIVKLTNYRGKDPVTTRVADIVRNFYKRDDISRQSPGMKDVITVRDGMEKEKKQVRHLYNSILETYSIFCTDNPEIKIGKSKFAALHPKHVLLSSQTPHNVCLCKQHENFIAAIESFKKCCTDFPSYSSDFLNTFLCKNPVENCWKSACEKCSNLLREKIEDCVVSKSKIPWIEWHEWKIVEEKFCKVVEEGTPEDLGSRIVSMKKDFFLHCFIKREQSREYLKQKEEVGPASLDFSKALLQVDFAENYTCSAQDEVQSFHWVKPQVSIFTISAWYQGKQHPSVIISDDLDHSKRSIVPYIDKILEDFPDGIEFLNIWSDGPTSQFKNRFMAAALPILEEKYNMKIIWNFFAPSHGKGPVDGIGGSMKREVRNFVKARRGRVFNASQFVAAAQTISREVKVILMNKEEIEERNNNLNTKSIFEDAAPLQEISKMHCIYSITGLVEGVTLTSQRPKIFAKQVKTGTFLLAKCCGNKLQYAAMSLGSVDDDGDVKVVFLLKRNEERTVFKTFKYESYISFGQIIKILPNAIKKERETKVYYVFPETVDVFEKH